ncbi:IOVO protein, partial [Aegotheles bennettii]|nr:IOVO protein [Aegotheles bennettii]
QASCGMFLTSGKTSQVQIACPRNYEPVCGTDGKTYPNECSLCREIYTRNRNIDKKHDGRCVQVDCTGYLRSGSGSVIPCTLEYSPICGTNGITYRNKCNFCNAVANGLEVNLRSYGECFQVGEQIDCGIGQQQGLNGLVCTSEFDPFCGSDGRTYGNKCQFCNAAQPGISVPQTPWSVLSAGVVPVTLNFPLQILQSNMLFPAPSTLPH